MFEVKQGPHAGDEDKVKFFFKNKPLHDLLYRDKQYEKECDFIIKILNKIAPKAKKILELGCGTGKHARLLAKRLSNIWY